MADTKYAPTPAEPPPSYETAAKPIPPRGPSLRAPLPLHLPLITSLRDKRCILASASPRRRQLLAQVYPISHPFEASKANASDRLNKSRNHSVPSPRKPLQIPLALRIRPSNRHPKGHPRLRLSDRQHHPWRTCSRPSCRHHSRLPCRACP